MTGRRSWRRAMQEALYGPAGVYRRPDRTSAHFRTSVSASPLFAGAITRLVRNLDEVLGGPDPFDLVDVGAGEGGLLLAVRAKVAAVDPDLAARLRARGVEVRRRPDGLPAEIGWSGELPVPGSVTGLLVANEWLDNVAVEVVEWSATGWRVVLVDSRGDERPGGPPTPADARWLRRWWPSPGVGDDIGPFRAEVGSDRDDAWSAAVSTLLRGFAVAIDYATDDSSRLSQSIGTLTGYRDGRQVIPVPDGSCDLTAHVALDACAAAGTSAGATDTVLTTQRTALGRLGIAADRPPLALAASDPPAYLDRLRRAGEAGELLDPHGLGAFGWLCQGVGVRVPDLLRAP